MNILDLLQQDKIVSKKVSGSNGGEYASACPACGGEDRFRAWPEEGTAGGKWWCRQESKGGDCIQYLREFRGMGYREACELLGVQPVSSRLLNWERRRGDEWKPKRAVEPCKAWRQKATSLVEWAEGQLLESAGGRECFTWLIDERGIKEETIFRYRLGWITANYTRKRTDWGLKEVLKEDGTPKALWIPRGLLISNFVGESLYKIKVRRPDPNAEPRYYLLPGSSLAPMVCGGVSRFACIVESELDAILLEQEAPGLAVYIALGSAKMRPDERACEVLNACDRILVALDYDDAGGKEAWEWWTARYSRAVRWPPIHGKDPGEMRRAGVDLRAWIQAGLPDGQVEPKAEAPKPTRRQIADQLSKLYEQIATNYTRADRERLGDEWNSRVTDLENALTTAWGDGGDCVAEWEALRDHWREGLRRIRGVQV